MKFAGFSSRIIHYTNITFYVSRCGRNVLVEAWLNVELQLYFLKRRIDHNDSIELPKSCKEL